MQQSDQTQIAPAADAEEDDKWRRAEIVAAIVHLYYMGDESFDPGKMPRNELAKLLGVKRHTVWRAINDAKGALALAEEIKRRLRPYYQERTKREERRKQQRAVAAASRRARERKAMERRERIHR